MVFGTFDILHKGHLHLFKQAKIFGDYLIVVISRDKTINEVKGKPPLHDEKIRLKNIQKLNVADQVMLGGLKDKHDIIRMIHPDIICLGYDQKFFTNNLSALFPKIKIVRLKPYKPNVYKTSFIKKKIQINEKD